jgi:15-cis-phytoene synthase
VTTTLSDSYAFCRALTRAHGTTYYWATAVLPRAKRPHVHALYGFCRYADDIVDDLGSTATTAQRADALATFGARFFADLDAGDSDHRVLKAVVHTTRRYDLDPDCFVRFLRSMTMDLDTASYATHTDLLDYMDGSAAVIGEMMLPILEPATARALAPARALGIAFQLTNFLRDVGEDLDRGRVYIPQADLNQFGVDPRDRTVSPAWRALMRHEIALTRRWYQLAEDGQRLLPKRSRRAIGSAHQLYAGILDRIEAQDYDVFRRRARVPTWRKVATVAGLPRQVAA